MTGHGEAHRQEGDLAVAVEVRTINSRYFKLSVRSGDGFAALDPRIETLVREHARRGTIQVNLKVDRASSPDDYRLNTVVLKSYRDQLAKIGSPSTPPPSLDALLQLPGVIDDKGLRTDDVEAAWPTVRQALVEALGRLSKMRAEEGRAMAEDLASNCAVITAELGKVQERVPVVVDAYRQRLADRLNTWLENYEAHVQPADIAREVGLFAEKSDIAEEMVRLRSHLDQFRKFLDSPESNGRKLDFLTQEMFRETNTIGSKANDAEISGFVIEIKAAIERMREMIQNVE